MFSLKGIKLIFPLVFLLTGCLLAPINSSSNASNSLSSEATSLVTSSSASLSSSLTNSETSIDLTLYIGVVDILRNFEDVPATAKILTRISGDSINNSNIIQGAWLIANDFYQAEFLTIATKRVELRIEIYDAIQILNNNPHYGHIDFVINDTEDTLGIQLVKQEITNT
jgi:hypothetical protein